MQKMNVQMNEWMADADRQYKKKRRTDMQETWLEQYSFGEQGQHTENNDSENMIIHGDNLEALKALLPQYEGKVKCIYIVILTPILMSILSSENAVRLNFIIHIMFLALFEMRNYNVLCGD